MSFIAGIVRLNNSISRIKREKFENSLQVFKRDLLWPIERIENEKHILIQASSPDMWEGTKTKSCQHYDAIATGVQWKHIPASRSILDYLTTQILDGNEIGNYFDYFSCAIIDKKRNKCVLVTDPLGISPVIYYIDGVGVCTISFYVLCSNLFLWNLLRLCGFSLTRPWFLRRRRGGGTLAI